MSISIGDTLSLPIIFTLTAALVAILAVKLEGFKRDRFISGIHRWKRQGGLSLVKAHN